MSEKTVERSYNEYPVETVLTKCLSDEYIYAKSNPKTIDVVEYPKLLECKIEVTENDVHLDESTSAYEYTFLKKEEPPTEFEYLDVNIKRDIEQDEVRGVIFLLFNSCYENQLSFHFITISHWYFTFSKQETNSMSYF